MNGSSLNIHRHNNSLKAKENERENKMQVNKKSQDIPGTKEEQIKSRIDAIQKRIREKEHEKDEARRREKEQKNKEEKKSSGFRIPKRKPEVEKLLYSLFDDTETEVKDNQSSPIEKDCKTNRDNSDKKKSISDSSHNDKPDWFISDNTSDKSRNIHLSTSDKNTSSGHSQHKHKPPSDEKPVSSSSDKIPQHKSSILSGDSKSTSASIDHKHKSSSSSDTKSNFGSSKSKDSEHSKQDSSSVGRKHNLIHSSSSKVHSSSSSKSRESSSKSEHKPHELSSSKSRESSSKSEHKPHELSSSKLRESSSKSEHKPHELSSSKPRESSSKSEHKPQELSSSKSRESSSKSEHKPKETSSSKPELKPSSPSSNNAQSPRSSVPQTTASDQQPIVLNKHHLHPVVERQASSGLSEKEKILARLQAIKQRTLEAIHKENSAKGRRGKGEKSQRKSKTDVKHDDKTKSVEIVRDIASSDEEGEVNNDVPSALDIMLSERNAKLEKEKITRMAKQAWERAMKKDTGDSDKEAKVKKKLKASKKDGNSTHKHKSSHDDKKSNHKKKDHSLSPYDDPKKSSPKPKKHIVRHSVQAAPPPMDFKALLEMAEKKQKEPPKSEAAIPKKKKEVEKRPLTQEEKDRLARKKTKEYQDWLKFGGKPPNKQSDSSEEDELPTRSSYNSVDKKNISQHSSSSSENVLSGSSKQSFNKQTSDKNSSRPQTQGAINGNNKGRNVPVNENLLVCGPGGSSDEEKTTNRSENPFDKIMNQFHKKRPAPQSHSGIPTKRNRIEDFDSEQEEEEYDSDMDGFIDDGDGAEPDYSKEIKKLFGYDKSKYKNERLDDLSDMEADYSTVMREEKRSAKLGLMEDLEDMRKEQEELKKKALLKKRK